MKIKIKTLLFVLLILAYCLTSSDSGVDESPAIKYGVLLMCIMYSAYDYYKKSNRKSYMKKEYQGLLIFVGIIIFYSLIRSIISSKFSFRTIQEVIFLVSPMIYGYFVINTWSKHDIDKALKKGLIISFVCYIISLGMSLQEIYIALVNANFGTSYSELESFTYCGLALGFCLYFCYYNNNKLYTILSVLFVVMTFKRLFMVIAVVLLIISQFKFRENRINKSVFRIVVASLFIFAIVYFIIMQPQMVPVIKDKYGVDIAQITMRRSDRMRWLVNSDFKSYGFGSTTEYMYRLFIGALEMETSKIIIELGYLPVLAFLYFYMKFAKSNVYVFVYMFLMMLNMVVSSGLTGTFSWCIVFISISMISIYPKETRRKEKLYERDKESKHYSTSI